MPNLAIKNIISFSSEDPKHCTGNLLSLNPNKTWLCEKPGEKCAYVLLQLEKLSIITGIDIGNNHSAFVEILVSRTGCNDTFEELLPMSSLMTPVESRNSTTSNRVRMFTSEHFSSDVKDKKWDQIKIICTQPFNMHVKYGLAFIKINGTAESNVKSSLNENSAVKSDAKNLIGNFRFREDSPDDNSLGIGGLFARRSELFKEDKLVLKPAAAIREASSVNTPTRYKNIVKNCSSKKEKVIENKDINKVNRNRDELLYNNEDMCSNKRLDILLERDKLAKESAKAKTNSSTPKSEKKKLNTSDTSNSGKKRKDGPSNSKNKNHSFSDDSICLNDSKKFKKDDSYIMNNSPVSHRGTVSNSNTESKHSTSKEKNKTNYTPNITPSTSKQQKSTFAEEVKKANEKQKKYLNFNELFKNVVFVLSGFENPLRSNLRQKAIDMGATYQPNWNAKCTHLICAFANTPKFQQVRGKGKIVKKNWIEDCHSQKKYIPWRRYSLVSSDSQKDESDEEILDISLAPTQSSTSAKKANDSPSVMPKKSADKEEERDIFDMSTEVEDEAENKKEFFNGKAFYLDESLGSVCIMKLKALISSVGGTIEETLTSDVDYNITHDKNNAISEVQNVKPEWIYECNDMEMILPINRYIL